MSKVCKTEAVLSKYLVKALSLVRVPDDGSGVVVSAGAERGLSGRGALVLLLPEEDAAPLLFPPPLPVLAVVLQVGPEEKNDRHGATTNRNANVRKKYRFQN